MNMNDFDMALPQGYYLVDREGNGWMTVCVTPSHKEVARVRYDPTEHYPSLLVKMSEGRIDHVQEHARNIRFADSHYRGHRRPTRTIEELKILVNEYGAFNTDNVFVSPYHMRLVYDALYQPNRAIDFFQTYYPSVVVEFI